MDMLMFGSNNYLGFANDPQIKAKAIEAVQKFGIGMAGPMILNGTSTLHHQLEAALARFKGYEDAMILPTGYQANLAWVNALLTDQSVLLYDESSHASLIDAIRMGRKKAFRFSNSDVSTLETLLKKYRQEDSKRDIWVCTQGVYSMTGEVVDLKSISDLCEKYRAYFVVDDAHGTGVLGKGKGTAEHFGITSKLKLAMGTFSKSFAVTGGFLAGEKKLINYIRFFARPYFFTAAMPPMTAAAVLAGIEILEKHPERVEQIHKNIKYLSKKLTEANIEHTCSESAIIPVFPPVQSQFREVALALHREHLFVNPIEPPAVPVGQERFRVSVMATHTHQHIDEAVSIFQKVFDRFKT
jgi:8-amino-7-oxononanoate synthase